MVDNGSSDTFDVGRNKVTVKIKPSGTGFEYFCLVDGLRLDEFEQLRDRNTKEWIATVGGRRTRISLSNLFAAISVLYFK